MARDEFRFRTQHLHRGDALGWLCQRVLNVGGTTESLQASSPKEESACRSCWWLVLKRVRELRISHLDFEDPDTIENDAQRRCAQCGNNLRLSYLTWRVGRFRHVGKIYCSKICVEHVLAYERERLSRARATARHKRAQEGRQKTIAQRPILKVGSSRTSIRTESNIELLSAIQAARGNTEPLASNPFAAGRSAREETRLENDDE
jgi:hypothetical protein